jgi:hypothetical protein
VEKPVTIEGQELKVATITVGALETIELSGKTGRKFNIALIAASLLAAGDTEHGTEAWVKTLPAFDPVGGVSPFRQLIDAANEVNGFKAADAKPGETEPAAPAQ